MKRDIKSMQLCELEEYFKSIDEKTFRAGQVFSWLHKDVLTFDEMTNLSLDLRNKLDDEFYISDLYIIKKQISQNDGTIKFLWGLNDGNTIESVVMEYKHGYTICISTQVGCKMGCVFCASSIGGFVRNLSASEMLDQVLCAMRNTGVIISNIVLMGMGEPLDNFDNVIRFVDLVKHPKGINIGARHITLSTCGIAEYIDKLTDYGVQLSLAISLHAPDDTTRSMLIPYNRKSGIDAIFEAAKRYTEKTGRRVTYEYAMIDDVNDTATHAKTLANLLRGTGSHLNMIILSAVPQCDLKPSKKESIEKFADILKQNGITFTTRRSLGADIDAACGQLRRKISQSTE
ncbi:MAG: 23S rRNA (adenine(2503)-C(2))-methyltransferase RlmN [Oscillospiraceae bacterium]|nr:23S rRNA (adenine(2503)-C(2))-methyltransferase RlmN [Oscillospiraceae bacterium]